MNDQAPRVLRPVRAAVFGTSALLLAATAHLLGGGPLPSALVLLAVGVPTACASVVLARRVRRLPSLLVFLAVGQVVLHEVFMTSSASSACSPAHTGHGAHAVASAGCSDAMPATHAAAPSVLMVASHALAIVATALLLAHGERVVLRVLTWVRPRTTAPVVRVAVAVAAPGAFRVAQLVPRLVRTTDVSRRGPPLAATTAPSFA